jgi:hypothetical protein
MAGSLYKPTNKIRTQGCYHCIARIYDRRIAESAELVKATKDEFR